MQPNSDMQAAPKDVWVLVFDAKYGEWEKAKWTEPGQYSPNGFWLTDDINAGEYVSGVEVDDAVAWCPLPPSPK